MTLPLSFTSEYSPDDYYLPLNDSPDGTKMDRLQEQVNSNLKSCNRRWKATRIQKFLSTLGKPKNDSITEHIDECDELADSIHLAKQRLNRHGDSHNRVFIFSGKEKDFIESDIYGEGFQDLKQEHKNSEQKHTSNPVMQSSSPQKTVNVSAKAA
jgi:hypothetical protein